VVGVLPVSDDIFCHGQRTLLAREYLAGILDSIRYAIAVVRHWPLYSLIFAYYSDLAQSQALSFFKTSTKLSFDSHLFTSKPVSAVQLEA
jgi:hypothetical protein